MRSGGGLDVFGLEQPLSTEITKAINHALTILSIYENVSDSDHVPPEYLWPFDDELNKWFDAIKDEIAGNGNSSFNQDGDTVPVTLDNEYAERFR